MTSTSPEPRRWIKRYTSTAACQTAAAHHQWLASLGAPVPRLHSIGGDRLEFEHVRGRHARPCDLPQLAELLGRLHHTAYRIDLYHARLDRPHTVSTGLTIPDFLTPRRAAVTTLLTNRTAPSARLTAEQAIRALEAAAHSPACLYKDSNPRNFLINPADDPATCVLVDFDVLTLAPPGYDLAKLLVTLTMTYGALPAAAINRALATYNTAWTASSTGLEPVPWAQLMTWAQIHHILTSPYLGHGGYRYTWNGQPQLPAGKTGPDDLGQTDLDGSAAHTLHRNRTLTPTSHTNFVNFDDSRQNRLVDDLILGPSLRPRTIGLVLPFR
jgi:hypothetical protein